MKRAAITRVPITFWLAAALGAGACRRADDTFKSSSPAVEGAAQARPPEAVPAPRQTIAEAAAVAAAETSPASEARPGSLRERLDSALQLSALSKRREALGDLGAALAAHDPDGAADVFKQIVAAKGGESGEAYAFASAFVSDYASLHPARAAEWMETLPLTLQFGVSTFVAREWSKVDLAAATTWAEQIAEPSLRSAVLARMSEALEQSGEPTVVAAWAQRVSTLPDAAQHAAMIGRLWATADTQGAFQWSATLSDAEQQTTAVVAIASTLARRDPMGAANWVAQFPDGDMRRQAAAATSTQWAGSDPPAAARWIASLNDQALLETAIHPVARRWLEADRRNATEWLRAAPLSPETKRYLLGDPPKG